MVSLTVINWENNIFYYYDLTYILFWRKYITCCPSYPSLRFSFVYFIRYVNDLKNGLQRKFWRRVFLPCTWYLHSDPTSLFHVWRLYVPSILNFSSYGLSLFGTFSLKIFRDRLIIRSVINYYSIYTDSCRWSLFCL